MILTVAIERRTGEALMVKMMPALLSVYGIPLNGLVVHSGVTMPSFIARRALISTQPFPYFHIGIPIEEAQTLSPINID
jgi:hypothetical protein